MKKIGAFSLTAAFRYARAARHPEGGKLRIRSFLVIASTLFSALLLTPAASAQFKDLATATSSLAHGFGQGDPQSILTGMSATDQVQLQFPGLAGQSGFFGRDQAAYMLDGLFNKVRPAGFNLVSSKQTRAEGLYQIKATWTLQSIKAGRPVGLFITLQKRGNGWSLTSVRTGK